MTECVWFSGVRPDEGGEWTCEVWEHVRGQFDRDYGEKRNASFQVNVTPNGKGIRRSNVFRQAWWCYLCLNL